MPALWTISPHHGFCFLLGHTTLYTSLPNGIIKYGIPTDGKMGPFGIEANKKNAYLGALLLYVCRSAFFIASILSALMINVKVL
ncbi:MAG: hypothetical protein ACJATV_001475 [Granulosicoccus sp.]|jgi:hypothetical protein